MKNKDMLQPSSTDEATRLTRVRAEVAAALGQRAPNEALLSAALEQVEKLIDETREELSSAVHELQTLLNVEPPVRSSEQQASHAPFRGSAFFFPW